MFYRLPSREPSNESAKKKRHESLRTNAAENADAAR